MHVIIVGAGQVGYHLAERLSKQGQDVVVVDSDPAKAEYIADRLDVLTVVGNGAAAPVLKEAGVERADLFLAVTSLDEVNIIGCLAADRMGVGQKVARISNPDFFTERSVLSRSQLGIDLMINPERECARETFQLLASEAASELVPFADGRVFLVGIRVQEGAPVAGRSIRELDRALGERHYTTVAIHREDRTVVPQGDSRIEAGDEIFLITPADEMDHLPGLAGYELYPLRRVIVAGGSEEAAYLAELLALEGVSCTILERDRRRCVELSARLPDALVLHGDATDAELLEMEGVAGVDGFVAFTDREETNLLACLLAKASGARKVVSLLHRRQYMPLAARLGVDASVSPRLSAANRILRYLHTANVSAVAALHGIHAEAAEVRVGPHAPVLGRPFRDIEFPPGSVVGAIVRAGRVITPRGDDAVQAGDLVILFARPESMTELETLFA